MSDDREDYRRGGKRRRGSHGGYLTATAEWQAAQAAAREKREQEAKTGTDDAEGGES